jgi:hypothetical protein
MDDELIHEFINPHPDPDINPPIYVGGFTYNGATKTYAYPNFTSASAALHGHIQNTVYGHGYHVNVGNLAYTCSGIYSSQWIMPQFFDYFLKTTRRGGWCRGCGFYLVNPKDPYHVDDPQDKVNYYYSSIPSGCDNYANYYHYACSKSNFPEYDKMRYQASVCLFYPQSLRWGVSSNVGYHKGQESFTYYEMIDLFVGIKLAGFLNFDDEGNRIPVARMEWKIIRKYCFILRLSGKDREQMRWKYKDMIVDERYRRYFTQAFFDITILERAPVPPALIAY